MAAGTSGPATVTRRRTESYLIEKLDTFGNTLAWVHPLLGGEITCQPRAPIGRTIGAMVLDATATAEFDVDQHLIRPWMILNGTAYPLGLYRATSDTLHDSPFGVVGEYQFHDQGCQLTGTTGLLAEAYGVQAQSSYRAALIDIANTFGITDTSGVAQVTTVAGNHLGWPPGTRAYDIAATLSRLLGLTEPWFDLTGAMQATTLPSVGVDAPVRSFGRGTRSTITAEGVHYTTDRWAAPTQWRVISKGTDANLSGVYARPSSDPLSAAARGIYPVERSIDVPGLSSDTEAVEKARETAQREARVARTWEFECDPDPEWDLMDTADYEGEPALFDAWTHPLTPGAKAKVRLREALV